MGEGTSAFSASTLGEGDGQRKSLVDQRSYIGSQRAGSERTDSSQAPRKTTTGGGQLPQAPSLGPPALVQVLALQDTEPNPTCLTHGGSALNTERKQPGKGQEMRNHICIMTRKSGEDNCSECTLVAKSQIQVF